MNQRPGRRGAKDAACQPGQPTTPRLARALLASALALGAAGPTLAQESAPVASTAGALDEAQQRELELLLAVVREPKMEMLRRVQAGLTLLSRQWPLADQALAHDLATSDDNQTRQAIVTALSRSTQPLAVVFKEPLLNLLEHSENGLQAEVAAALGNLLDASLTERLSAIALDPGASERHRRGAVLALAHRREQPVAATLLRLAESQEAPALKAAAFEGLATLTGIDRYGSDLGRWQRWWRANRDLSQGPWLQMILQNFARRQGQLIAARESADEQLVEAQRQLYRATAEAERPQVLLQMIGADRAATRRLALTLIEQRLIDNQPINEALRTALLGRLSDEQPIVRQGAALLLRDLREVRAADAVAQRLAQGGELDPGVLGAYLRVMARMPRAEAVGPMVAVLSQPAVGTEAAAGLAAAAEAGLLEDDQRAAVAAEARRQLAEQAQPDPQMIRLLGYVGQDEDWPNILAWLDHEDDRVKLAAAQALAGSDQPILPLIERAGDPVLWSVAISAAAERGVEARAFELLINHEPQPDQRSDDWRRAVVAMAGRVSAEAVAAGDAKLAQRGGSVDLRLAVLEAGIDRLWAGGTQEPTDVDEQEAQHLAQLLLARVQLLLDAGNDAAAQGDLQMLESLGAPLGPALQVQQQALLVRAALAAGQVERALTVLDPLSNSASSSQLPGDLITSLCTEVWEASQAGDATAIAMLSALRSLLENVGDTDRIEKLDQHLAAMTVKAEPVEGATERADGGEGDGGRE